MFSAQGPQVLCFMDSLHTIEVAVVQFAQVKLVHFLSRHRSAEDTVAKSPVKIRPRTTRATKID